MIQILKQTSWLLVAQALSRIIGFFYTIFLARNLGVSDFGLYSAALAYFSLVSTVVDFGFDRFLIREIAREQKNLPELLGNIGILRLTLGSVIFALFGLGLYLLDPDKLRVTLVLLAVLAVLPHAISLTLDAIFVALQKLQFSAITLLFLSFTTAIFGTFLINEGFGAMGAVVALILGQSIYLLILVFFMRIKKIKFFSRITPSTLKAAIIGSLPYGLLGVLGILYFRVDLLLLTYMRGNFEAGIYGAAYKFFEAVVFIPSALATALFPIFAKLHIENLDRIKKIYFKSLKILLAASLIVVLVNILLLPVIIRKFLPNYLPSIEAIRILSLAIPFMFGHFPAVQVLLSTDKYLKTTIWLAVFLLSLNIGLNLIFIPKYGFLAASWITVFSEALSFLIFFKFLMIKVLRRSL